VPFASYFLVSTFHFHSLGNSSRVSDAPAEPSAASKRRSLRRLEEEAMWIEKYRQLWDARFDELDELVEELKRKERADGRRKRS
jgi:hypothetical protein